MECNDIIVERFDIKRIRRIAKAPLICIYISPEDYPRKFVARLWDLDEATRYIAVAETLDAIRGSIPEGMIRFCRDQNDPPCIVETWI